MLSLPEEYIIALEAVLSKRRDGTAALSLRDGEAPNAETRRFLSLVAERVTAISTGLTSGREDFVQSRYLSIADMREAYLAYYMSTNLLKLWAPLREMALGGFFDRGLADPFYALDLGAGPGTAAASLLLYLNREQPDVASVALTVTDILSENLRTAEQVVSELRAQLRSDLVGTALYRTLDLREPELLRNLRRDGEGFKLVLMMNALNELPEQGDRRLIEELLRLLSDDGALIVIEPAMRELSRRALRFRDLSRALGAYIYAPCVREADCPALSRESDWCHSEVSWERPGFIRTIDELAGTLRLSLKYTYFAITKAERHIGANLVQPGDRLHSARVVSEVFHERGRIRAILCDEDGRREHVMNLRDKSPGNAMLKESARYDLVEIGGLESRQFDVKIPRDATFRRLVDASGARIVDNLSY